MTFRGIMIESLALIIPQILLYISKYDEKTKVQRG